MATVREASLGLTPETLRRGIGGVLLVGIVLGFAHAESNSELTGRVVDPSNRAVPAVETLVCNLATLVERSATTNNEGINEIPALPVGTYRMQVKATGFRLYTVEPLTTDVARTLVQDVRLEIGEAKR